MHANETLTFRLTFKREFTIGQFGSRFIRTLLFLYSFKGPFNTYLIYFTFIKSVAINKDLSQPLRAKGKRISETKHDWSNLNSWKVWFMLMCFLSKGGSFTCFHHVKHISIQAKEHDWCSLLSWSTFLVLRGYLKYHSFCLPLQLLSKELIP